MDQQHRSFSMIRCPHCGASVGLDHTTCNSCGEDLMRGPRAEKEPIKDRKTYRAYFAPRARRLMQGLLPLVSFVYALILCCLVLYAPVYTKPYLLQIHLIVNGILVVWVYENQSLGWNIAFLCYHVAFYVFEWWTWGIGFALPVAAAVVLVVLSARESREWRYYVIRPTAVVPEPSGVKKKRRLMDNLRRVGVAALTVAFLVVSCIPTYLYSLETADDLKFSVGEIKGNRYENPYLNINVNIPDDWYMMTFLEIDAYNRETFGDNYDPKVKGYVMNAYHVCDDDTYEFVDIYLFKEMSLLGQDKMTADDVFSSLSRQYFDDYGSAASAIRQKAITLNGWTYNVLRVVITYEEGGVTYTAEEYYLLHKELNRWILIYVCPGQDYSYEDILSFFGE